MDNTRPYQSEAASRILQALGEQRRHILAVMPTGSGKSKVVELLARELLSNGTSVTLLAIRRSELEGFRSRLNAVPNRHPKSDLQFAVPPQLFKSAQSEYVDITGHVVIVAETGAANFLKEDSGVWASLQKAAAVIGFTAVPSSDLANLFGEPVYTLAVRDAVAQGILPRVNFTSFALPAIGKDATEAQIEGVLAAPCGGRFGSRIPTPCLSRFLDRVVRHGRSGIAEFGANALGVGARHAERCVEERALVCETPWHSGRPSAGFEQAGRAACADDIAADSVASLTHAAVDFKRKACSGQQFSFQGGDFSAAGLAAPAAIEPEGYE